MKMRNVILLKTVNTNGMISLVDDEVKGQAKFHSFGVDYEEFESVGASYSVAIVEFPDGHIEMPRADRIRFVVDVPSPEKIEGRWEHCSPELLAAGIDCINTPRRECADGGHEHFISDDRLEMKTFDTDGKLVGWFIDKTQSELENAHVEGKCSEWCPYCVTEAEESLGEENFWKWPVDGII